MYCEGTTHPSAPVWLGSDKLNLVKGLLDNYACVGIAVAPERRQNAYQKEIYA